MSFELEALRSYRTVSTVLWLALSMCGCDSSERALREGTLRGEPLHENARVQMCRAPTEMALWSTPCEPSSIVLDETGIASVTTIPDPYFKDVDFSPSRHNRRALVLELKPEHAARFQQAVDLPTSNLGFRHIVLEGGHAEIPPQEWKRTGHGAIFAQGARPFLNAISRFYTVYTVAENRTPYLVLSLFPAERWRNLLTKPRASSP